jgi:hypothetical protein
LLRDDLADLIAPGSPFGKTEILGTTGYQESRFGVGKTKSAGERSLVKHGAELKVEAE